MLEKLYDGSVTTLYKAKQDRLGRLVALKTVREWPPPNNVILDRFNRATYVSAQVVHPNLAVLYETGTADGHHFAAHEFIQAQTLQELLAERTRVSERRAVWVGLQVARALGALHEKRVIHRNVKPKNILVEADGRVRLVGLGLAKVEAACFAKDIDAQTIGTPHYMAPEIIRGCCCDARSDLYSLGVTMYVMVTGRPPFAKGIPAAVMAKHLYEQPVPLREAAPDVSPEFVELVERLMAKCPHERLASAEKAAEILEQMARKHYRGKRRERWIPAWLRGLDAKDCARAAGVFFGTLALIAVLGMAAFGTWAFFFGERRAEPSAEVTSPVAAANDREPEQAAAVPAPEAPAADRALAEFRRLSDLDPVYRRDRWRGVREWEAYLRVFPELPAALRREAEAQVERYRRQEQDRQDLRPMHAPRGGGENLEF
ncbi:MAG: serine/threonine protein kinase [Planctomycetota bacterium]|nr:serine/threonine protein kinase [Planctomycetota bacterium]